MSKLSEYLKLAARGIPNIHKIAEGIYYNTLLENKELDVQILEEVTRRRLICHSCPLMSLNAAKDDTEYRKLFGTAFELDASRDEYCGSCGCPLKVKTASLSTDCGLTYYNSEHPENKQPLKWEKYNQE